jgi:hypothetical protein
MATQQQMIKIFSEACQLFDAESELKDALFTQVKKLDTFQSSLTTHFSQIHQQDCDTDDKIRKVCDDSEKLIDDCVQGFLELDKHVPPGQYYRWNNMWSSKLSNLVFYVVLKTWLVSGQLPNKEEVQKRLKVDQMQTIMLGVDDYLFGVCNLASELSRFCINCVTRGDMNRPFLIKTFLTDLYASFRLLNLKNDALRKRFDGVKYDVKKVEEIVYDLSVRGFKPTTTTPSAATTTTTGEATSTNTSV